MESEIRFKPNGACTCERISRGECKQISACDCCEYFQNDSKTDSEPFFYGFATGSGYYVSGRYFRTAK